MRKYNLTEEQTKTIRDLYLHGLSYRRVAAIVLCSRSAVQRVCKDIGRSHKEAAKPGVPRTSSTHWRTMRGRARTAMEHHIGRKLESWEHVHHIDKDITNNDLTNLAIISAREHAQLHHRGPDWEIPRHLRPGRKAYMREYRRRKRHAG